MVKSIRKRINISSYFTSILFCSLISACSIQKAQHHLLQEPSLQGAHIGTAVYNQSNQTWVDRYQSNKYFTPASNTKILSCYVGMKYLKDSIPGWQIKETVDSIYLLPMGDPTFLHPDFSYQPVADIIKNTTKQVVLCLPTTPDAFSMYGKGWAWDDYADDYQPERSRFPIYGNVVTISNTKNGIDIQPKYFIQGQEVAAKYSVWTRDFHNNHFYATGKNSNERLQQIPFITDPTYSLTKSLIEDTLHPKYPLLIQKGWDLSSASLLKTVPTDTLLKIMMNRSDNFYAEQILLMTSAQLLNKLDESATIEAVLKNDLNLSPQNTHWADGSGLSRFNLNTPENFVALLQTMQAQFGLDRIKNIFAQGGEGTLGSYYKNIPGVIYAKTGTLGNQVALSGFIVTQKGTELIFSVLVANHVSPSSSSVRKAVEKYLTTLMRQY
jgi:D-alanyl-D-alanine carboxypeptidase/D-alanyl-D-alanine-endopeptidase (penicillin-binding protein 4)